MTTAVGLCSDLSQGAIDRFRTLPMAKSAVVSGHVIADLPRSLLGLGVTVGLGFAIGFRSPAGLGSWAAAIGITLLVTFALTWIAAVWFGGGVAVGRAIGYGTLLARQRCASMGTVPMLTNLLDPGANLKENFPGALGLTILVVALIAAVFIGGPALWRKLH